MAYACELFAVACVLFVCVMYMSVWLCVVCNAWCCMACVFLLVWVCVSLRTLCVPYMSVWFDCG